jgi:ribosomal protein S18 acetylase RimI-like enzyme
MMHIHLRNATEADFNLTYQIKKNALNEYLELTWGWNDDAQFNFHREEFKNLQNFNIIEWNNQPVGYTEIIKRENGIFIANIMILKHFQGQGVGKILMQRILSEHSIIHLEVLKVNVRATTFYQNHGFIVVGEDDDVLQMSFSKM